MSEMRLIDANALNPEPVSFDGKMMFVVMLNDIRNAPTVEAVPVVHGHWNYKCPIDGDSYRYCSNCLEVVYDTIVPISKNYCPNCGTKMDE